MKKKIIGIILCLLVAVLVTGCDSKKEEKNMENSHYVDNLDMDNDGLPDGGEFKYEGGKILKGEEVIYDPAKDDLRDYCNDPDSLNFPNKSEITNTLLYEYIKIPQYEMYQYSYKDFTGDRLHQIMLATAISYLPANTKQEIARLAKAYFGVDNYELPVGTYYTSRWGTVNVLRIGDFYLRVDDADHYVNEGMPNPTFYIKSFEQKGSELVVVSELADRTFSGNDQPDEITKIYGTQTMYLEYTKDSLIIKKVDFKLK